MLTQSLTEALNAELTRERIAVATYMACAGVFQKRNLLGFVKWGLDNSHEESGHAEKFFAYLCDQDEVPVFADVPAVTLPGDTDLQALTAALLGAALTLEQTVTEALKQIYAQAESDEDPATKAFLYPFLTEQVKAEHELGTMIGYLKDTGIVGLAMLNAKLETD